MAVQYERYENEIEAAEDELSIASDDEPQAGTSQSQLAWSPDIFPAAALPRPRNRYLDVFQDRWPFGMGISLLTVGAIIVLLGLVQILILPLAMNPLDGPVSIIQVNRQNAFGVALWAGLMLALTGCFGIRAALMKYVNTMYVFFACVIVTLLVYIGVMLLLLISYSSKWTTKEAYPDMMAQFYIMLVESLLLAVGLVLLLIAFTQHYENVLCGDWVLCRRALHCCFPCWCPRVVEPEELMEENNRQRIPSLPI